MSRLRDQFTLFGNLHYLAWRALGLSSPITVKLKQGGVLRIRQRPQDDIDTAHEIFSLQVYKSPIALACSDVRRVLDLGANVGMSSLYLLSIFPNAIVKAVEPSSTHVRLAEELFRMNELEDRIEILEAAAAVKSGTGFITGEGVSARVSEVGTGQPVKLVDIFEVMSEFRPDFLKIDIEGSEYSLLNDPRFAKSPAAVIVIEWHHHPDFQGKQRCESRLRGAGYRVVDGAWNTEQNGFVWGYRHGDPTE